MNPIARYTRWLHTRWPAGRVERLPVVREDFSTNVPGLLVVGDLTGIPLLKFSVDGGTRAVRSIVSDPRFQARRRDAAALDLVIVGGGVSGMAAALEAHRHGLRVAVLEANESFSTIANFPARKPIYAYPTDFSPAGELDVTADVKEELLEELRAQTLARGIRPRIARAHRVVQADGALRVELEGGEPPLAAHRVIVAVGRAGDFRRLGVPGEDDGRVLNRLHDPRDLAGQDVVVVGGGDSAVESAVAVAEAGGRVVLVHRGDAFPRAKPENVDRLAALLPAERRAALGSEPGPPAASGTAQVDLRLSTRVVSIEDRTVHLDGADGPTSVEADTVLAMIGRDPPLPFLRRCGIRIRGDWTPGVVAGFVAFLLFCVFLYHWKTSARELPIGPWFETLGWFPFNLAPRLAASALPETVRTTLSISTSAAGFYYALAYAACVVVFGVRRIRRRRTPYVAVQTAALMAIQCLPLFLLPELLLPAAGHAGVFGDRVTVRPLDEHERATWRDAAAALPDTNHGQERLAALAALAPVPKDVTTWDDPSVRTEWPGIVVEAQAPYRSFAVDTSIGRTYLRDDGRASLWVADQLFPPANYGHGREYWRAYGLVLAWPLFVYNAFTDQPLWLWLAISFAQTFVLIPLLVLVWGKGAYCGWICSCGALAETLGDTQREKMPHGPFWNRLNMTGQVILAAALALMALRIVAWSFPGGLADRAFHAAFSGIPFLNYKWSVDLLLAGILGVGCYFWLSGRVWCRFACPLAALMHVYARFSRFRIFADKKKCISCNVCTSVCHQGIDVMSFANKGLPMEDPECVRCSACVQSCPTGVLAFGRLTLEGRPLLDRLAASRVRLREDS